MKLPGVKGDTRSGSARPIIPAKKPIRQQPPGLKMRFRPIGFGNGEPGRIGSRSSSADGSSDESSSDRETSWKAPVSSHKPASQKHDRVTSSSDGSESSSDVEMTDVLPPPAKKPSKLRHKDVASISGVELKKKHNEEIAGKIKKHGSSQSTIKSNHKKLNNIKIKQIKTRKIVLDSQSVSIEHRKNRTTIPP